MILVFGGTTEGRSAAEVLEEAGSLYYYSTKMGEQELTLHHGVRIDGAMDAEAMKAFCCNQQIRLIVDAAHPFASMLHQTIGKVASDMRIPVIRYDRIYPQRDPDITWIDDYLEVPTDIHTLLATTGVQSISKLKWLEELGVKVIYRILRRESSLLMAYEQGATDEQLCYFEDGLLPKADAILLKESGLSGGFVEKVEAAREKGMRIIVLKRPSYGTYKANGAYKEVNGPYGLRRMVEKLLPEFYPLHSGLTTGTCATAAAIAATIRLTKGETPAEVPVLLPDGETITVPVGFADRYAYCIKEAGDDPDVTDGIEVRAHIEQSEQFEIIGGEGVGRFTLPGFDYPVGEAAINKGPREMMRQNIKENVRITISVPQGTEIAKRTFNPRLGIEGGISIIGVSGIVKPFSEEAFIDSIRKCMTVAKASGAERVVINSGGKSEHFVKALYPTLPQQAFVEYGNYIGETLKIANELNINTVTLGVMLGKAVKLAEGHLDTHSRKATMDKAFIQQILEESGISIDISDMTLARELWERIAENSRAAFAHTVIRHCYEHCAPLLPNGELTVLLIDDNGKIYEV
ncbi:cobalt-precorrin-5B (C(1))-methyltransferase CbiD [uncultured Prevotella sp.]|uniref:cobalt-precorrin-5B (C(1))-methyltransferase CbiD n=1 Tax=uncultured Prevotella sp. TaxID=159272 RepID=UPI0025CEAB4C|nr:cobalt-precorrin-5B (C(1))-methyltransferase CbiD [uncultured Prevotella sp.]